MKMNIAVFLRIMLFISLSVMVYDYLKLEQSFIQMERGFIDGFSLYISPWPGLFVIITTILFLVANIVLVIIVWRNKNADKRSFLTFEYDVSDERAVGNTRKAVSHAFSILLIYSLLMIGSYMYIPNYFVDHIWYPLFTTASIPIVGLISYLIVYKVLQYK
ncbi:hypothetical protein QTL97_14860 [Sporosarcina thermotolerans]|uniref:DUF2178 domain-containing protein n=1 Tax=Sporosarcina thermotolerans TaxID=633404 RepID=A0AAW9AGN3_9BACL|nr:hypothetical protein [Sporosarcina thermotolerans]MDW0118211.1 hypothetical protein [Sporosarcina thermotolerans]